MPLAITTPPVLDHLRDDLVKKVKNRADIAEDDTYFDCRLKDLCEVVLNSAPGELWRTLFKTSYRLDLPCFPNIVHLPYPPLMTGTAVVKYYDDSDVLQTLSSDPDDENYVLDEAIDTQEAATIRFLNGSNLVTLQDLDIRPYPVQITWDAGYIDPEAADIDLDNLKSTIREGLVMHAYALFRYPERCDSGLPESVKHFWRFEKFRDDRVCYFL